MCDTAAANPTLLEAQYQNPIKTVPRRIMSCQVARYAGDVFDRCGGHSACIYMLPLKPLRASTLELMVCPFPFTLRISLILSDVHRLAT